MFDRYHREGYVANGDPCIIAINLRDIPHAWADAEEFWFRALYGVGDRFVAIDRSGGATMAGREHRTLLQRAGGAVEDVAPLLRQERAGISGVLGSSTDVGNVPNPLGGDFATVAAGLAPIFILPGHASPDRLHELARAATDLAAWISKEARAKYQDSLSGGSV
jgi:hypothetical protein